MSTEWTAARDASARRNKEAFLADLEARYLALEKERNDLSSRTEADATLVANLQKSQTELQQSLTKAESELATVKQETLTVESNKKNQGERISRLEAEGDSLREEIVRLTKSNKDLRDQVVEFETRARLNDYAAVPLQFEVERVQKELDSLTAHATWLEEELSGRTQQMVTLKTQHGEELVKVRQDLDKAVSDRDESALQISSLQTSVQDMSSKLEKASSDLRQHRLEASAAAEAADKEVHAERRLASLQKEQLDRLQSRHDGMEKELESLRVLASKATAQSEKEVDQIRAKMQEDAQTVLTELQDAHDKEVSRLKKELAEATRLRVEAEEGLLASPPRRKRSSPARLSAGGGGGGDDDDEEPLGLTDLYAKLNATEDELHAERSLRKKNELYLQKIRADIAAKTPVMQRQRQQYEWAMERQEESQVRLQEALQELSTYREEAQEARLESAQLQKRNRDLQQESRELAKQVQAMLASKAGGDVPEGVPTSIEEMQSQNQQLLSEHIRLTSALEELEQKLRTDPTVAKLEAAEEELSRLREERNRQEALVSGIAQQRDLLRALVGKQDGTLGGDSATELAVAQQSEQQLAIEGRNKTLEQALAKARADLTIVVGDKDALEDRVARYSSHTKELTSSIDKLQIELSSAVSAAARSEADASFYRDKSTRAEESLQMAREELSRIKSSKEELQSVNSQLQQAVVTANAEVSRFESEARQAGMKARLAETQAQTAKAAESRLSVEVTQLRNELVRQGALLDSVQKIEASLAAQSEVASEKLKEELDRLTEQLESERSKHLAEMENLQGRIREIEIDMKSAEEKKDKAMTDVVAAKKETMSATGEMQKLKAKCVRLEAELGSAKKKLGGTESSDVDVTLEAKIETLSQELDASRAETEKVKERAVNFQKLAKTSEEALAELTKTTDEYKKAQSTEVDKLRAQLQSAQKESQSKDEMIAELTKDLGNQRGEQDKAVSALKTEIAAMKNVVEAAKKDADAAVARAESLTTETEQYRADASKAQGDYERELSLHAAARTDLRSARDEVISEQRLRRRAEEQRETEKIEHFENERLLEEEKKTMEAEVSDLKKGLEETRGQNEVLHQQLATLGDQIEKSQSERLEAATSAETSPGDDSEEAATLRKTISELREVVKFMRSERDMNQAQLDAARRTAEREKAATSVTKRSLDEARAELRLLQAKERSESDLASSPGAELGDKLKNAENQLKLLSESNQLFREEAGKLEKAAASAKAELEQVKGSTKPTEEKLRDLQVQKASLESEKDSLKREVEAWKGRVESLISKFNQVDPEEHQKVLDDVATLKKKCDVLKAEKESAEKAKQAAKLQLVKQNKELSQHRTMNEKQKAQLTKLSAASKSAAANTEVVKERDQLKEDVKRLQTNSDSLKTELDGSNSRNEKLKERMRQFQKQINGQRKLIGELTKEVGELKKEQAAQVPGPAQAVPSSKPAPTPDAKEVVKKPAPTSGEALKQVAKEKPKEAEAELPQDAKAESGKELPSVPKGGFKFGPGGAQRKTSIAKPPAVGKTPTMRAPMEVAAKSDQAIAGSKIAPAATEKEEKVVQSPAAGASDDAKKAEALREKLLAAKAKKRKLLEKKKDVEEKAQKRALVESEEGVKSPVNVVEEKSGTTIESKEEQAPPTGTGSLSAAAAPFKPTQVPKESSEKEETKKNADSAEDKPSMATGGLGSRPFGSSTAFGSGTTTFGGAAATFGGTAAAPIAFGTSSSVKPATDASTPAASVFGSSSSVKPAALGTSASDKPSAEDSGAPAPAAFGSASAPFGGTTSSDKPPTGFGAIARSESSSSSVFLDMKPPSSSAAPFSFGSSSIKLPTPANPVPMSGSSPFGAFASNPFGGGDASATKSFGGGTSTQPLFGSSAGVKRSAPEAGAEEEEKTPKQARIEEADDEEEEVGEVDEDEEGADEDGEVEDAVVVEEDEEAEE